MDNIEKQAQHFINSFGKFSLEVIDRVKKGQLYHPSQNEMFEKVIEILSQTSEIEKIVEELHEKVLNTKTSLGMINGDLSDLGNEIGVVVGKYLSQVKGFDKDSFIDGIKHGLSISDGTHQQLNLDNLCSLCLGTGQYHTGGSFGGPTHVYRCSCQDK